ncbi:MAG: hypothetical protein LBN30_02510 [Oscillospiraceae bacterium]|nr:hypothetical protein [Oscillospiraceae bacterium]
MAVFRKFSAIVLAIVIALTIAVPAAYADDDTFFTLASRPEQRYSSLALALNAAAAVDTVTLTGEYAVNSTATVPDGKTVTLTGASSAARLIRGGAFTGAMLTVGNSTTGTSTATSRLILQNITIDGNKAAVRALAPIIAMNRYGKPTLVVRDGAVLQNNHNETVSEVQSLTTGGAIATMGAGSAIEISGGRIIGNTAQYGGAFSLYKATLTMTGGVVEDNTATMGGAAFVRDAHLKLFGGALRGNTSERGGAVYAFNHTNSFVHIGSGTSVQGEVYIEGGNARVAVESALTSPLSIAHGGAIGDVLAVGTDAYTLTTADARMFRLAASNRYVALQDGQLVVADVDPLYPTNETNYTVSLKSDNTAPEVGGIFEVAVVVAADIESGKFSALQANFTYNHEVARLITATATDANVMVTLKSPNSGMVTRAGGEIATEATVATLTFEALAEGDAAIAFSGTVLVGGTAGVDASIPATVVPATVRVVPAFIPPTDSVTFDEDYNGCPTGYKLMLYKAVALPDSGFGFDYDGNAMYYAPNVGEADEYYFLYIVPDGVTESAAKANITNGTTPRAELSYDGEVSGNGALNIFDAQIAYDLATHNDTYLADGGFALSIASRLAADINGDGQITVSDARAVQYKVHYDEFPTTE